MADRALEFELGEGLQSSDGVESERSFEVLGASLLDVFLKKFDARCAALHLISSPDHEGVRQVEEILVRSVGGQRPSGTIDQVLLENLGGLEVPQLIQEFASPDAEMKKIEHLLLLTLSRLLWFAANPKNK